MSTCAVLDENVVREIHSIDPTLFGELVGHFSLDGRRHLDAMAAALAAGNREELARHAHAMKGASGSIGAERVQHLCDRLQKCSLEEAKCYLSAFEAEFMLAHRAMQDALQ